MKKKLMLLVAIFVVIAIVGCTNNGNGSNQNTNNTSDNEQKPEDSTKTEPSEVDTVSSASQAPDEATFEQKISKDGNYIIITPKDLKFTKDLTVDGIFTKKDKDGNEIVTRSLALATYGEGGKVNRYTLTVPRIVINSENTLLEYGTIKGDVYIQALGFKTKDATIDGNLYFATQELMNAFSADELTKITGVVEVKEYKQ